MKKKNNGKGVIKMEQKNKIKKKKTKNYILKNNPKGNYNVKWFCYRGWLYV